MKIGLISDVHSNLEALEAVLKDLSEVDLLVNLGDVVGYGPYPSKCLNLVREEADLHVRGNHDRMVGENLDKARKSWNPKAIQGLEYTKDNLSDDDIDWVSSLPDTTSLETDEGKYLVAHSHPENRDEYVFPRNFPEMRPYLDEELGIFLGHTHVQHKAVIDEKLIVNPGSVGQPRDDKSTAAYAILDTEKNTVELHRTEYDIESVINTIKETPLPVENGTRLR